jgi:hypothetical protein
MPFLPITWDNKVTEKWSIGIAWLSSAKLEYWENGIMLLFLFFRFEFFH